MPPTNAEAAEAESAVSLMTTDHYRSLLLTWGNAFEGFCNGNAMDTVISVC